MSKSSSQFEQIRSKRKPKNKESALWLTTFADLSFLIICFFAMLVAYSTLDKKKMEFMAESTKSEEPAVTPDKVNLKTLSKEILAEIKNQKLMAKVLYDVNGIAVEFDDQLFFSSGSANLNYNYRPMTSKLMQIIAKSPSKYNLILEGHTDDEPLHKKSQYGSNWELSSARAVSMLNEMKRLGVKEDRMSVIAYAHTKPKVPWAKKSGQDLTKARAANRRVVIRIQ